MSHCRNHSLVQPLCVRGDLVNGTPDVDESNVTKMLKCREIFLKTRRNHGTCFSWGKTLHFCVKNIVCLFLYKFFYHHLSPHSLPPPVTTLLSTSVSTFSLLGPSTHPHHPLAVICSPSMSLSLFCLLVQFVH